MKNLFLYLVLIVSTGSALATEKLSRPVTEGVGPVQVALTYLGSKARPCDANDTDNSSGCASIMVATVGIGYLTKPLFRTDLTKTKTVETQGHLFIAPWGEGKAKIGLELAGQK